MARSRPRRATPGFKWEGNKLVPLSTTKWNDETQDWDINPDESDLADDEIPKKDDDHSLITGGATSTEFGTEHTGGVQSGATGSTGLSLKERQALLRGEKIYRDGVEIDKDGRPVYQGDAPSTEVGGGGHDNAPGATPVESHEQTSINWQTNQHQAALDARDRDIASRGQARRGASAQDGNKAESGSLRRGIRKLSPSLVTGGPK